MKGNGNGETQEIGVESRGAFSQPLYRYTIYKGYIMRETFERVDDRLELKSVEIRSYKNIDIEYIEDRVNIIIDTELRSQLRSHKLDEVEIYFELSEDCNCECGGGW